MICWYETRFFFCLLFIRAIVDLSFLSFQDEMACKRRCTRVFYYETNIYPYVKGITFVSNSTFVVVQYSRALVEYTSPMSFLNMESRVRAHTAVHHFSASASRIRPACTFYTCTRRMYRSHLKLYHVSTIPSRMLSFQIYVVSIASMYINLLTHLLIPPLMR